MKRQRPEFTDDGDDDVDVDVIQAPDLPTEIWQSISDQLPDWRDRLALTRICKNARPPGGTLKAVLSRALERFLSDRVVELPYSVMTTFSADYLFSPSERVAWQSSPPLNQWDSHLCYLSKHEKILAEATCFAGGAVRAHVVKYVGGSSTTTRNLKPSETYSDFDIFFDRKRLKSPLETRALLGDVFGFHPENGSGSAGECVYSIASVGGLAKPLQCIMTDMNQTPIFYRPFTDLCGTFDLTACQWGLHGSWWDQGRADMRCTPLGLASVHSGVAFYIRGMNGLLAKPFFQKLLLLEFDPAARKSVLCYSFAPYHIYIIKRIRKYMFTHNYQIPVACIFRGASRLQIKIPDWCPYATFNEIPDIARKLEWLADVSNFIDGDSNDAFGEYTNDFVLKKHVLVPWPC